MLKFTLSSSQVNWRKCGRPDGVISNKPLDGVSSQQTCVTLNLKQASELHCPAEASSRRIFTAKAGINPIIVCVVFVVDKMALDQVFFRACCSAASHFFPDCLKCRQGLVQKIHFRRVLKIAKKDY